MYSCAGGCCHRVDRPRVGNAIAAFGEPGRKQLEAFRLQRKDKWLAWAAYQVLYVPQPNDAPTLTTEAEAVATHAKYAPPFPRWRMDKRSGHLSATN
jgi:hypothetical protein